MNKKTFFICLFILIHPVLKAQGFSVQAAPLFGTHLRKGYFFSDNISGLTLDLNRRTNGKAYWQGDHRFPQMGLQLMYRDFDDALFRNTISLLPYLEFNIARSHRTCLQVKHGTGLAYVAGLTLSGDNSALGSKLNASSIIDIGLKISATERLHIKPGLFFHHISNGNLVNPNAGLNTLFVYLNFIYFPKGSSVVYFPFEKIIPEKKWGTEFRISCGFFDYRRPEHTIGLRLQHTIMPTFQHSTRFRTGLGLEILHNPDLRYPSAALYTEESVCIGHLVTRYGLGYYLKNDPYSKSRIYEKIGIAWFPFRLKAHTGHGFSIGSSIKAHKFKAAFIDLSAGYLF